MSSQSRSRRLSIFTTIALLVGLFVACNADRSVIRMLGDAMVDSGRALSDAASPDAMAQVPECTAWEVKAVVVSTVEAVVFRDTARPETIPFDYRYDPIALEAGWEPYSAADGAIYLRRCVTP